MLPTSPHCSALVSAQFFAVLALPGRKHYIADTPKPFPRYTTPSTVGEFHWQWIEPACNQTCGYPGGSVAYTQLVCKDDEGRTKPSSFCSRLPKPDKPAPKECPETNPCRM